MYSGNILQFIIDIGRNSQLYQELRHFRDQVVMALTAAGCWKARVRYAPLEQSVTLRQTSSQKVIAPQPQFWELPEYTQDSCRSHPEQVGSLGCFV
jgi:hypothetical protein